MRAPRVAVLCGGFAALLCPTGAITHDFKGIELGRSTTRDEISTKLGKRCRVASNIEGCVALDVAFAGIVGSVGVSMDGGIVTAIVIQFDPDDFAAVERASLAKFGEPVSRKTPVVQNRMGAQFENVVSFWTTSDQSIRLEKYAKTLDKGRLTLATNAALEKSSAQAAERAKDF